MIHFQQHHTKTKFVVNILKLAFLDFCEVRNGAFRLLQLCERQTRGGRKPSI